MDNTIPERYERSIGALNEQEIKALHEKNVCIIGCGGLGGYILEMLARLGILNITVVDGDVFSKSNLNRQILCTEENISEYKAEAAVRRIKKINSEVHVRSYKVFITDENAAEILRGHDVIIDALDNVPSRLLLEKHAEELGIPLIHGAIRGWFAQTAVIKPGDRLLYRLYQSAGSSRDAKKKSFTPAPPFTPVFCASLQVTQAVKLLLGKETLAGGKLLMADLSENSLNVFDI